MGFNKLSFSIGGLENVAISDNDLDKSVGEISVGLIPFLAGPMTMGENDFNHKHIGESITNSLVDKFSQSFKLSQGSVLSGSSSTMA